MTGQFIILAGVVALLIAVAAMRRKPATAEAKQGTATDPDTASGSKPSSRQDGEARRSPTPAAPALPKLEMVEDEDLDITQVTLPRLQLLDEDDVIEEDTTTGSESAVVPIVFDEEAAVDKPTDASAYFLVSAVGQTHGGQRRRRNEDAFLVLEDPPLFAVADGMGGYAGGDVASDLAVKTVASHFHENTSKKTLFSHLPRRASELAHAMLLANLSVWEKANHDRDLEGMGTTFVAARFSPRKERVYIGHVGDSRCYLFRDGRLTQVTTDHTLEQQGIAGPMAGNLTRAVGISPTVEVDIILGRPQPGDVYLLCSDGLSKMVGDDEIARVIASMTDPQQAVDELVDMANAAGGRDNITVILVRVEPPVAATRPDASKKKKKKRKKRRRKVEAV